MGTGWFLSLSLASSRLPSDTWFLIYYMEIFIIEKSSNLIWINGSLKNESYHHKRVSFTGILNPGRLLHSMCTWGRTKGKASLSCRWSRRLRSRGRCAFVSNLELCFSFRVIVLQLRVQSCYFSFSIQKICFQSLHSICKDPDKVISWSIFFWFLIAWSFGYHAWGHFLSMLNCLIFPDRNHINSHHCCHHNKERS
jgi:hypothetical protein